jgi:hypothetical protein
MSGWQFETRQFLLPKSGYQLSECEDAIGINPVRRRFAVADGATEAFDARTWARQLAQGWVEIDAAALSPEEFRSWVNLQGNSLHDSWRGLELSWYAEEKAREGSYAAFVGLQLDPEGAALRWRAIAVGDACLIHCRQRSVLTALPLVHSEQFNATPVLVPSRGARQSMALQQTLVGSGEVAPGDVILLLSDAAAAWYLMLTEQDDAARHSFDRSLKSIAEDELTEFFVNERQSGRIKDDDIALLRIEVEQTER